MKKSPFKGIFLVAPTSGHITQLEPKRIIARITIIKFYIIITFMQYLQNKNHLFFIENKWFFAYLNLLWLVPMQSYTSQD